MEMFDDLRSFLPIILLGVFLLIAVVALAVKIRKKETSETRQCPHCKQMVETSAIECDFCHRKVAYG